MGGGTPDPPDDDPIAGNVAPTVRVSEPATDIVVSREGRYAVAYTVEDPEDALVTDLYLDADGDLESTGDQHARVEGRQDAAGVRQELRLDAYDVPPGEYDVVVRCSDGSNPSIDAYSAKKS